MYGFKPGAKPQEKAPQGKKIKGPGNGTSDSIKTDIPKGSYIMPADSTQQIGPKALGELGDARAVPDLVRALNDKYWPVQRAAATALGRIGDPAAVSSLKKAAGCGDWRVRQAAEAAVRAIETPAESRP